MQILFGNRYFENISSTEQIIEIKKYLNNNYRIIIDKLNTVQLENNNDLNFFNEHVYYASFGFTNKRFVLFLTQNGSMNVAYLFNLNSGTLFSVSFSGNDELFKNNVLYGEILTTKQTNIFFVEDIMVYENNSLYNTNYSERFEYIKKLMYHYNENVIFNDIHLVHKEFVKINNLIDIFDFYNNEIQQISQKQNINLKTHIVRFIPNKLFSLNYDLKMFQMAIQRNNNNKNEIKLDKTKQYNFKVKKDEGYTDVYSLYTNNDMYVGKAYIKDIETSRDLNNYEECNYKCEYNIKFNKWMLLEKI